MGVVDGGWGDEFPRHDFTKEQMNAMVSKTRRAFRSGTRSPAFWLVIGITIIVSAVNLSSSRGWLGSSTGMAQGPQPKGTAPNVTHLREGTEMTDLVGRFKLIGDRIQFLEGEGNGRTFKCLENLMLQRIFQSIKDDDRDNRWIVQGKITEYSNENFLLIEGVVRSPRSGQGQ